MEVRAVRAEGGREVYHSRIDRGEVVRGGLEFGIF